MRYILILPIRFYRYFISPLFPPSCRFTPTCSEYAIEVINEHGPLKGTMMAVRRVSKCHPWSKSQ
ncbi:MAG: membrane protein insertion efficiency factor YidD [Gammaproteobacteria bacterium]